MKDLLGQGTFGQVVRCVREDTGEDVAVKVIKNQPAFYHQVPWIGLLHAARQPGEETCLHRQPLCDRLWPLYPGMRCANRAC